MAERVFRNPSQHFSLSLSADYIVEQHHESLSRLIPLCDTVFGNLSEALALASKLTNSTCHTIEEAVKILVSQEKLKTDPLQIDVIRTVLVTQGPNPVICGQYFRNGDVQITCYPVPQLTNLVDTIGAGDAFLGAVLSGFLHKLSICESVNLGITTAGKVCQKRGCMLE